MGITEPLPDHMAEKISDPKERRPLRRKKPRSELKEQRLFATWLKLKKEQGALTFIHPRSDKRSTVQRGVADFTVKANGRVCSLEFKAEGGKLSPFQLENLAAERAAGNHVDIVFSADDAIKIVRKWLDN